MYRLLNARNLYPNGFHNISVSDNIAKGNTLKEIKCLFCQKMLLDYGNKENVLLIRHQSTRTASALQKSAKKKVKYKIHKRFGEVLEVNDKNMTETKISINKFNAAHLSKLAASSVSLGQLHELTKKSKKSQNIIAEVDPELLQSIKDKILNKTTIHSNKVKEISLEDDQCALVFTSHKITSIENRFKTKQCLDTIKDSYYNFRKTTLYDQRLNDLQYAINEGLNQELDLTQPSCDVKDKVDEVFLSMPQKGPHAVFKELFFDNHLDNYDQELMSSITNLHSRGVSNGALDEILEEISHNEIGEAHDEHDNNIAEISPEVIHLNMKKARKKILEKKKAKREKRRMQKEQNMRNDLVEMEKSGKQQALHKQLVTHLQLLCSQDMLQEGRQIVQYYRMRGTKAQEQIKISIKVYNTMLHGYASKGLYNNVVELLSFMQEDKIEANPQTFAAIFECIERSNLAYKHNLLKTYYEMMREKSFTFNDIMDKSMFVKDQREVVLKAICKLEPAFQPVYTPPQLDYVCPLVERLSLDNAYGDRDGLKHSPAEGLLTLEELKGRVRKQLDIEIKGEIEVQNINIQDETSDSVKFYRNKLTETENEWREVIKDAFIRNLSTLKSQGNASQSPITLYPYLKVLPVEQFVELIMIEISKLVDGSETYSPSLKLLQRDLGTQVFNRYLIEQYHQNGVLKKLEQLYDKYCEWYLERKSVDGSDVPYNCRQAWQMLQHQNREGASLDVEESPWSMETRQNVGKFLYNIIIHDIKIDVNMFKQKNPKPKRLPGVYKVHRPWGRLVRLELKPHPVLARLWAAAARPALRMRAALLPLAAPAAPWAAPAARARAAYLLTDTPLVRIPLNVVQQLNRLRDAPPETLYPVLDTLNQLGEVPWTINKPILDLQLQVFRSGGSKKLDVPQPPSSLDTASFARGEGKAAAFRRRVAVNRARAEMYSLWCDGLYKLSLANHYRDEIFWLPHNLDFRGRVYACPPHLSQLGADGARALLRFARARPLGAGGLRWLKLHAINLTGAMKKKTLDERLAYADSIIDKIIDSADRPLDGEMWWTNSEEPWQTLACCMEIANALRSGNPEGYMCGFPVHQDGSCNGLQHYAALGGDAAGAAAVNLAPRARPMDVYSAVAALVEEMRAKDAAQGITPAIVLENFVRRKVIKQTVMTTVYGVTKFGARLQIAKQLKDIDNFPKEHVWSCSNYLTTKTFDSLREMFTSTKLIQDWFTDCAKVISGVCGESVEWVTPLGLPVVQPYFKRSGPTTSVATQAPIDHQQRPCTIKQKNAFPPNFIHSLDSTHMMLTALWCQARGLTFVSVHDCFWTHPDSVDLMNEICREQFVALHSQPILDDLSDFLVKRYGYTDSELMEEDCKNVTMKRSVNSLLEKVPGKGDFQLDNVLKSVYFFS